MKNYKVGPKYVSNIIDSHNKIKFQIINNENIKPCLNCREFNEARDEIIKFESVQDFIMFVIFKGKFEANTLLRYNQIEFDNNVEDFILFSLNNPPHSINTTKKIYKDKYNFNEKIDAIFCKLCIL